MNIKTKLERQRTRRKNSIRAKIRKRSSLPRLAVHRSTKHMFAQIVDDAGGRAVCAVGTVGKAHRAALDGKTKTEQAKHVGTEIAKKALEAGVERVVFDRGGCKYTGRVKALADAAREAGLKF
jgi:large subunit ribosomal protein L18